MTFIVHVGFPKAASTFLQENIFDNKIFNFELFNRKEITNLYGKPGAFEFDRGKTIKIINEFKNKSHLQNKIPVISQEFLVGNEYLNGGIDAPIYLNRIYQTIPDAKIIIIIREQRSFLYSFYKHDIAYNNGFKSIEKFINNDWHFNRRSNFLLRYIKYDNLIKNYYKNFGKENVLVLPYEMLKEDKSSFIENIINFTRCDKKNYDLNLLKSINISRSITLISLQKYLNKFITSQHERSFSVPLKFTTFLNRRLFSKMDKIFFIKINNKKIDKKNLKKINKIVGDYFVKSNINLQRMLNISLKKYNYRLK